ncbi:MAG: FAD-dependent oxidoreductase [Anaerolineae bacterium]
MRDVVIIGGGLSGLAAAWELTKLNIPYTLIEVKRRFGGAIISESREGFVMDGGPLFVSRHEDWSCLTELGLQGALIPVDDKRAVFRHGTQTLTDALANKLSTPAMKRMAVSSLGKINEQVFGVCLENGILLDARALIIAAPARYAEKMLRELQGDIALRLLNLRYDSIIRLSLGYRRHDVPNFTAPAESSVTYIETLTNGTRMPADCVLIQAGMRFEVSKGKPQDPIAAFTARMGWQAPLVARADYWPEADLLRDAEYTAYLAQIPTLLPAGTALIGSDYLPNDSLRARMAQGRAAAQQIAAYLAR